MVFPEAFEPKIAILHASFEDNLNNIPPPKRMRIIIGKSQIGGINNRVNIFKEFLNLFHLKVKIDGVGIEVDGADVDVPEGVSRLREGIKGDVQHVVSGS